MADFLAADFHYPDFSTGEGGGSSGGGAAYYYGRILGTKQMNYLRQSTASQTRTLGPFVDDTDFKTLETALTIANTDIKLSANGGASANKNSGGGTHVANGIYAATFDATDTATVGELAVSVSVAGALVVRETFFVLEEVVYDAMYASTAPGFSTVAALATIKKNAFVATELAIGTVTSQTVFILTSGPTNDIANVMAIIYDASDAAARVVAEGSYVGSTGTLTLTAATGITVTTSDTVTLVAVASTSTSVNVTQWGGTAVASANVLIDGGITAAKIAADAITDAKVAADVTVASVTGAVGSVTGAVGSVTGNVGGNVVGTVASVTGNVGGTVASVVGSVGSVTGAVGSVTGNVGGNVVGSVASVTAGVTVATITANAVTASALATDAVTEIQSGLATAAALTTVAGYLDTEIAAILADTDSLQTEWANGGRLDLILDTAALGGSGGLDAAGMRAALGMASANLDTQLDALPTAVETADAVWDEATSGHVTSGTYGASVLMIGVDYRWTRSGGTSTYDDTTVTRVP